jgi:hypothetical protein
VVDTIADTSAQAGQGRVSNVVEIGGRRNLRVPRSTDRRWLPPREITP